MKIQKVYDAPTWTSSDGMVWYKHISALDFVNRNVGWVVGADQISLTRDGGKTWSNQFDQLGVREVMIPQRVVAVDSQTAWILGLSSSAHYRCYYTRNTGKEWQGKSLPSLIHPNDIFFVDKKHGWIVSDDGDTPAMSAVIHTTSNGGLSWRTAELEIKGRPAKVKFMDPSFGLLLQVTTDDRKTITISNILQTTDGGNNWRLIKSFNRLITDLCIINRTNFLVIGDHGFIAKTTTGGDNWRKFPRTTDHTLNTIIFDGYQRVIIGGDCGVLVISDDFGEHWSSQDEGGELDHIVDVSCLDKNRAIFSTTTAAFLLV